MNNVDITSRISLKEYGKEGKLGKAQAQFLNVFEIADRPLTRMEALDGVKARFFCDYRISSACGRMKELEGKGLIRKLKIMVIDPDTKRKVRVWEYVKEEPSFL